MVIVMMIANMQVEVEEAGPEPAVMVPVGRGVERERGSCQPASRDEDGPEGAQRAANESSEPAHGNRG